MNKIDLNIYNKSLHPKKMLLGTMLAGSLLCGGLASCTNKSDTFETNKIEYVQRNNNQTLVISDNLELKNRAAQKRGAISGFKFISKNDSPLKNLGKRISAGLLGGFIGALIGTVKCGKSAKGGAIGTAAGVLFPGMTLTAIITGIASYTGAMAGTLFSGGNEKIGKITAVAFGILTALACLL